MLLLLMCGLVVALWERCINWLLYLMANLKLSSLIEYLGSFCFSLRHFITVEFWCFYFVYITKIKNQNINYYCFIESFQGDWSTICYKLAKERFSSEKFFWVVSSNMFEDCNSWNMFKRRRFINGKIYFYCFWTFICLLF